MRIAFISQWYDPEAGSAAIPGTIVRSLRSRGHEVEVVTAFPNYPSGRTFPGYRVRPLMRETLRGVRVNRVAVFPSHDRNPVRRMLSFVTFMLTASTIGSVLARRKEVALVYSTPGTVGLVGVVLRRIFGRPFVLYVQDLWPDTVTATGMLPKWLERPASRVLSRFCSMVYRSASRIAVISPGMRDILITRDVPAEKIDVIYNWVDEQTFHPSERPPRVGPLQVMYAGSLGDVQGLEVAIQAIAELGSQKDVVLRLVGDGLARSRLQQLADHLGVSGSVRFEGPKPIEEMARVMASADVQLVCLRDLPLFHLTMPSKIQATLACALPLLVSAPGDAARLVTAAGAGLATQAGDARELAGAMRKMSEASAEELIEMGQRGRRYYETRLSAEVGSRMLETSLYEAMSRTHVEVR